MVNANVVVSVSLLSIAALATLAVIYTGGGFSNESTISDLCAKVDVKTDEIANICEELSDVPISAEIECDNGKTFTMEELLVEDPDAAYLAVETRCLEGMTRRLNGEITDASIFEAQLYGEDGVRKLFNDWGWCTSGLGSKNAYCTSKHCDSAGCAGDGRKHKLSDCCAEHDECLYTPGQNNQDAGAKNYRGCTVNKGGYTGKCCDKRLSSCAKKEKCRGSSSGCRSGWRGKACRLTFEIGCNSVKTGISKLFRSGWVNKNHKGTGSKSC